MIGTRATRGALACHPTNGDVAYPAGACVVVLAPRLDRQRAFLRAPRDDEDDPALVRVAALPAGATTRAASPPKPLVADGRNARAADDDSSRRVVVGASAPFACVSYSPSGGFLAGGETGFDAEGLFSFSSPACVVWDAATHRPVASLRGHRRAIDQVAFASERVVVTLGGARDGHACAWDFAAGALLAREPVASAEAGKPARSICCLASANDPFAAFVVAAEGDVSCWTRTSGPASETRREGTAKALGVAPRRRSESRLRKSRDRKAKRGALMADARTNRGLVAAVPEWRFERSRAELGGHAESAWVAVEAAAFEDATEGVPDAYALSSAGVLCALRRVDNSGEARRVAKPTPKKHSAVSFTDLAYPGGIGATVDRWVNARVASASALGASASRVVVAGAGGVARLFAATTLRYEGTLDLAIASPHSPVTALAIDRTLGSTVAFAFADGTIGVWALEAAEAATSEAGPGRERAGGTDDARVGGVVGRFVAERGRAHAGAVRSIAAVPSANRGFAAGVSRGLGRALRFATVGDDGVARTWVVGRGGSRGAEERSAKAEEEDGNRRGGGAGSGEPLSPGAFAFTRVAARPDGRELAVGDARGRVRIFDLETLEERLVLAAHDGAVTALAYDGDGVDAETTTLVSAGEDGAAHAFDASLPEPTSDDEAASAERGEAGRTPRAPHGEGRLRAASKKQKQKPASGSHPHMQRVVNANPPDERARTAGSARRSGAVAFAAFAGSRLALFRRDGAATAYARVPSGARASTFARCDEGLASSPDASLEPARGFGLADVSVSGGGGFRSGEEGSGGEGEGTTTRRVVAIALGADGCIRRRETALVSGGGARAGANPIRASASPPSARRIVRLRLTPPSAGAASAFALAPSGGACAVSSEDGGVRTFDPATGACVGVGLGHAGAGARGGGVRAMAYAAAARAARATTRRSSSPGTTTGASSCGERRGGRVVRGRSGETARRRPSAETPPRAPRSRRSTPPPPLRPPRAPFRTPTRR